MGFWDEEPTKRTLGIRDKQILYRNAKHRCQNPACGKKIEFDEMQTGHKIAASKGGRATLKNSVCLCYRCNKLQGTDSWSTFLKKQGIKDGSGEVKDVLKRLSLSKLKYLANKYNVKVKGGVEEGLFESHRTPPSKLKYVNMLSKALAGKNINSELKDMPQPEKKRRRRRSSGWGW